MYFFSKKYFKSQPLLHSQTPSSKIILKNKKKIILKYFQAKKYFKPQPSLQF
jgi:hypothetical protein